MNTKEQSESTTQESGSPLEKPEGTGLNSPPNSEKKKREESPKREKRIRRTPKEIADKIGVLPGGRIDREAVLRFREQESGKFVPKEKPEPEPETELLDSSVKNTEPHVPLDDEEESDGWFGSYNPFAFDPKKGDSILGLSGLTTKHSQSKDFVLFKALLSILLDLKGRYEKQVAAELAAPLFAHFVGSSGNGSLLKDGIFFALFCILKKFGFLDDIEAFLKDVMIEAASDVVGGSVGDSTGLDVDDLKDTLKDLMGGLSDMLDDKKET